MDRGTRSRGFDSGQIDLTEIGFGDHDHRLRTALPCKRQEPLDPAEIDLRDCGLGNEDDVDIGGEHLAD